MQYLRTNTATRVTVGPFLDKTDGVTPETAITVTSCKLTFVVDDGGVPTLVLDTAPTASGGANDMVHITGDDSGYYDLELAAANVNYFGRAKLSINDAATHCPVFHEFTIIPAVVYDAMILGTDLLDVSVTQLLGTAWLTPGTAGTPDVNVKLWNALTTVELPLVPTVAGRKLDVSAGGEAGLDWNNIGNPTATAPNVNLFSSGNASITSSTFQNNAIDAAAIADGAIDAATFAANAITAAALAADAGAEIADAILNRDMSTGTDSGSTTVRTPRQALRVLRNKVDLATTPGTMDVKKEDDSTSSWTAALTTDGTADPITVIDPAGP